MKEDFLYFLWKFQYFYKNKVLQTCEETPIQVIHQGFQNHNAGADFSDAKIMIGNLEWFGNVEIHILSSDWYAHKHHKNKAYDSVILHVVWEKDKDVYRTDGTQIPTLSLKDKVPPSLLEKYKKLVDSPTTIPCSANFENISRIKKLSVIDRVLIERLQRKADEIISLWKATGKDWEEVTYCLLAKSMGGSVNQDAFLRLASTLPFKRILQHSSQLFQVEAMLFGQSGLLKQDSSNKYVQSLLKEYHFLSKKYSLDNMFVEEWKFARLRPPSFPTLRIAQLAALLVKNQRIFSKFILLKRLDAIFDLFDIEVSDYWQKHYAFDKESKSPTPRLGKAMMENIMINTIAPLLVAYGQTKGTDSYLRQAVELLDKLPAETNKITKLWKETGLTVKSSFDSQASIELYKNYCTQKKCLNCAIGVDILKNS